MSTQKSTSEEFQQFPQVAFARDGLFGNLCSLGSSYSDLCSLNLKAVIGPMSTFRSIHGADQE